MRIDDEVEADQRQGQGHHGERVGARGEDAGHHRDQDDGPPPPVQQLGRRDHADQLEGDQDDRELEGQPEEHHHEQDQAQVLVGVVDLLQGRTADPLEEAQGVREDVVGQRAAGDEQAHRGQHEGDGVALLGGPEPRGDEPPELPQDDRRGQDEAAEGGDLDPQRQAVQRPGDVERAVAAEGPEPRVDAAVGVLEEIQDVLVEDDGHRGPHHVGHGADDQPPTELAQVLGQRHVVGGGALLVLATVQ